MASYFGINQDYASTFFGNYSSSSTSSSSSLLSDYASIKNGSYKKLMKSYYAAYGTNSSTNSNAVSGEADTKKQLTTMKDDAKALSTAAEKLYKTGSGSVFNKQKVTTKDETTGTESTSYEYDKDGIYKAVKSFVDSYNDVLGSAGDSNDTSILRSALGMTQATQSNSKLLSQVGITINSDNTLSLDEDAFKKADVSTIKSLFNGTGSYAYSTAAKAFNIESVANSKVASGQLYGNTGSYAYLSTGTLYDSIF